MSLALLIPIDTRPMFRPVSAGLVDVLRRLSPEDWNRRTLAPAWTVRDVLAHLLDVTLRRLSFHRDEMAPPPPSSPIASERDFIAFINDINAQWVRSSQRLSPRVLTDLFERAGTELADWFENQPMQGPALFGVSWAGERASENWFDIGREFTELWHHQQQIRLAVGADSTPTPQFLHAVIDIAARGLPHAYRDVPASSGQSVVIEVAGPAGGEWTLVREGERWALMGGSPDQETARLRLDQDAAWMVLFNALPPAEAARKATISGNAELAKPLLHARSVLV